MKKKKLSLHSSSSRPDGAGVAARALLHRPPTRWSVACVRRWAQPHNEALVGKLLEEYASQ
jgi:hypothetical protein